MIRKIRTLHSYSASTAFMGCREQPPCGAPWVSGLVGHFVQTWPDSECSHTVQFLDYSDSNWRCNHYHLFWHGYNPFGVDVPLNCDIIKSNQQLLLLFFVHIITMCYVGVRMCLSGMLPIYLGGFHLRPHGDVFWYMDLTSACVNERLNNITSRTIPLIASSLEETDVECY